MDAQPDPQEEFLWVLDAQARIILSTSSVVQVLGYQAAHIVGLAITELLHPEDQPALHEAITSARARPDSPVPLAIRVRHASGAHRLERLLVSATAPAGESARFTISLQHPATPEPQSTGAPSAEAGIRALQKWEALGSMAFGMGHDLDKLIGAARDALEQVLSHPGLPEGALEAARAARGAAHEAGNLTRSLLALGRELHDEPRRVAAGDVINRVMEVVHLLSRANVHVRSDVTAGAPVVLGSEAQLYRALLNLCINALEAMEQSGGVLELRLDAAEPGGELRRANPHLPAGPCVRISVRDEGRGIPADVMARLFEPFFSTKPRGMGLGLMVVRAIVRAHGGAVEVDAGPGRGSRFSIYLPPA